MPLQKGHSKEAKRNNMKELRKSGYPRQQAIAIMLSEAGESKPKQKQKPEPKSK